MQLTPPGIPFPQEMGGAEEASSPVANAVVASVAATSPAAMMNAVRRIGLILTWFLRVRVTPIGPRTFGFNGAEAGGLSAHSQERGIAPDLHAFDNRRDAAFATSCMRGQKTLATSLRQH